MDKPLTQLSSQDNSNIRDIYSALEGRENEFIDSFYQLFLSRYQQYAHLFEHSELVHKQRMIKTLDLLLSIHNQVEVTRQNMKAIGREHRQYNLTEQDLQNFKQTFLEHLEVFLAMCWSDAEKQQMNTIFDTMVIPAMIDGMK